MTSLSFIECCRLLNVDPKTLRQWLTQAQIALHAHSTDARVKCLTQEQVFVLANLHDRILPMSEPTAFTSPTPSAFANQLPLPSAAEADLRARLAQLEAQVATLQTQLTNVALQLLQERQYATAQQQLALSFQTHLRDQPSVTLPLSAEPLLQAVPPLVCHPTEKRNPLIPLIECGAKGHYVLISPEEGELAITPDSPVVCLVGVTYLVSLCGLGWSL
ncbi:hypothetical protein KSC_109390 [Ktedonobacter sp. SOSP1-52]|uniref:hypothetical protein n=1 Tax=Ktedonobacter sp. SOSP1-52 TaxID=2778366 RepID=UPI0019151632|nr:hypothetical protein [Ktedonobacter sp. SOSP1-52]GHO72047.1 hypothetical protein KSC_109390 [Ktedonobacter sp. SOSP1-52]